MGQRGSGTGGWWVWVVTGVVVTIGAVALLEPWFRVSSATSAGWGALAVVAFQDRRRVDHRRPLLWVLCAAMVLIFVGVGLLLGAAGLSDDDRADSVVPGAVLGAAMLAAAAITLLVLRVLQRRKAVTDEVERHRAEEVPSPTTTADDLS